MTPPATSQTQTTQPTNKDFFSSFHNLANQKRLKNVTTKGVNPLFFKDPNDRQAATLAKIQRMMDTPQYKSLKPEQQLTLRSRYYDDVVTKVYGDARLPIPDKATWVEGVTRRNKLTGNYEFGPESFYENGHVHGTMIEGITAGKTVVGVFKGMLSGGVWIGKQAALTQLGLTQFFRAPQFQAEAIQHTKDQAAYAQGVIDKISHGAILDSDFWLQTHPTKDFAEKADAFIGEQLAQLPLYEAIGGARGVIGVGENLTKALAISKVPFAAKLTMKTLMDATDAFLADTALGKDEHQTKIDMASYAGFNAGGRILGAVGSVVLKKLSAKVIAMGGRPLQEILINEAEHEIETGKIGGHPTPHGDATTPDHVDTALKNAHDQDPVKTKLTQAYKVFINSVAQSNFNKPFKELSTAEKSKIKILYNQITSTAVRELPVRVPEIAQANAESAVAEAAKLNPTFAKNVNMIEKKYGVKVSAELQKAEARKVKTQTGIKSSQAIVAKVAKADTKGVKGTAQDKLKAAMAPAEKNFPEATQTAQSILKTLMTTGQRPSTEVIENLDKRLIEKHQITKSGTSHTEVKYKKGKRKETLDALSVDPSDLGTKVKLTPEQRSMLAWKKEIAKKKRGPRPSMMPANDPSDLGEY